MNGNGGTFDLGTGLNHTTNNTVILTAGTLYGNSSTLNVNYVSTSAWGGSNGAVFSPGTSTVNFTNGAQRLSASGTKTFYNLTASDSGLKTFSGTVVVNGTLTIEGTATVSAAPTYGANGGLRYNTATARTAGVEWITPFVATGGVSIGNTGTITMDADKVLEAGVPLLIETNAVFDAATNILTLNGDMVNNGTWTPSSGDIIITGNQDQNIGSFTTSGVVFMTKSAGTATLQGDEQMNELTMNGSGGTLDLGSAHTHTITNTWTNTAGTLRGNTSTLNVDGNVSGTNITFTPDNGMVHYRGTSAQSIPQIGRAVQQECRDRSRMPSSA
eukprot:TRINITY_DN41239_c0_g1_i1.p1 TRINITY_DN41239_c0_g1~~TRINITY_DN41239_c0_g1_i1.p1  ORF type:complete len:364 (-),score=39.94 TRINITY_DN41239_c0_g1_i1:11-997(-)